MINDNNSFSTIDRLVEFGMGLAVAQQMVNTMNHCIGNMQVAGTGNALGQATSLVNKSYYLIVNNAVAGPFSEKELYVLAKSHTLKSESLLWCTGMSGWTFARNIPEVMKIVLLNS